MAADDRKRKILQHLSKSGDGMDYDFTRKKTSRPISFTPPPPAPAEVQTLISNPPTESTNSSPSTSESTSATTPAQSSMSSSSTTFKSSTFSNNSTFFTSINSLTKTKIKDRKRQIMDHLKRSSSDLKDFSAEDKQRKSKILEHLRKSLS